MNPKKSPLETPQPVEWHDEKSSTAARMSWLFEVTQDRHLWLSSRVIAAYLSQRFNGQSGDAYPSMKTIAADIGISVSQVRQSVAELEQRGWIMRRRARRTSPYLYAPSRIPMLAESLKSERERARAIRYESDNPLSLEMCEMAHASDNPLFSERQPIVAASDNPLSPNPVEELCRRTHKKGVTDEAA